MISINIFRKHKHTLYGVLVFTWKFSAGLSTSREDVICKKRDSLTVKSPSDQFQDSPSIKNHSNSGNTVINQFKHWSKCFQDSGIPEPELSARYIIEHVLKIKKNYEYDLNLERELTGEEESEIKKLSECRLARMPVQYIIKEWDFRDLTLSMTPPVFIPRPETEQLVDLVLEKAAPDSMFLEVGCGSGAICLSLLKALPKAHVIAIDQSRLACQLTEKNAQLNKLTKNLQVVHSKLQEDGSLSQPLPPAAVVDVLVSNPPYVPNSQLVNLEPEIKLYEDLRALEAGRDGLRVVRSLLTLASSTLRPGGLVFLEVDSSHPPAIQQYVSNHSELDIQFVKSYKDYCERDRFVELVKL